MRTSIVVDETSMMAEASKQATKALKCVAFTSKQVGDMLMRRHERVLNRISGISMEIESLEGDMSDNVTHQRERRHQVDEVEEDIERAQLLGNNNLVEELMQELCVLKDETRREDSLYRAFRKTVRSRKAIKKQFLHECSLIEDELRNFSCKQQLIQTLLATCTQQSSSVPNSQESSASQSDCGASNLDEDRDGELSQSDQQTLHLLSTVHEKPVTIAEMALRSRTASSTQDEIKLSAELAQNLRPRSFTSDCVPSERNDESELSPRARARQSLSVHFAFPEVTALEPVVDSDTDEDHPELAETLHNLGEDTDSEGPSDSEADSSSADEATSAEVKPASLPLEAETAKVPAALATEPEMDKVAAAKNEDEPSEDHLKDVTPTEPVKPDSCDELEDNATRKEPEMTPTSGRTAIV